MKFAEFAYWWMSAKILKIIEISTLLGSTSIASCQEKESKTQPQLEAYIF